VEIAGSNFACGGVVAGWRSTLKDQGSNDTVDSDGDPLTHRSDLVVLAAGAINADTDFGFYVPGSCSTGKGHTGVGNGLDPQPPGNPPINDSVGVSGVGPGENCSPRGGLDSGAGASKAPGSNPSPSCTLVFNATTGDFQALPASPSLANLVAFQLSPWTTGAPAPQPGVGSGTPVTAGQNNGLIDWAGSYGVSGAPATIPGPTTGADKAIGLIEAKGNGTNGRGKIPVLPLSVSSPVNSSVAPAPGSSGKKK
jgi:hypothetical protein